jgi:hypothetical protein
MRFEHKQIMLRRYNNRIQIVKLHPGCIPNEYIMSPKDLNNKFHKIVHSAVVKQIRPYFKEDKSKPMSKQFDYTRGYQDLPEDLLNLLISNLI